MIIFFDGIRELGDFKGLGKIQNVMVWCWIVVSMITNEEK
jgi:hypothetical protein